MEYLRLKYGAIITAQKMKFPIKNFFSKCDQIRRRSADLVTFTEEILNGRLHSLCSVLKRRPSTKPDRQKKDDKKSYCFCYYTLVKTGTIKEKYFPCYFKSLLDRVKAAIVLTASVFAILFAEV